MGAPDRTDGVLPPIPDKRYFTIGEVSELCLVKPYVLRYWEQEFVQLKPMKRRGNRRYYQHHEVMLVRRIRELLYEQGFTIQGARNQLADVSVPQVLGRDDVDDLALGAELDADGVATGLLVQDGAMDLAAPVLARARKPRVQAGAQSRALQAAAPASLETFHAPELRSLQQLPAEDVQALRAALLSIRDLLS